MQWTKHGEEEERKKTEEKQIVVPLSLTSAF